jgi:hypothetical protein
MIPGLSTVSYYERSNWSNLIFNPSDLHVSIVLQGSNHSAVGIYIITGYAKDVLNSILVVGRITNFRVLPNVSRCRPSMSLETPLIYGYFVIVTVFPKFNVVIYVNVVGLATNNLAHLCSERLLR